MERLLPVVIVLALASAYGLWYRSSRGKVKSSARAKLIALDRKTLGSELGERATLVQFSSAFCTPCRMTRTLITDVITDMPDVRHIDIDAESHLDLVRRLDIRSTPTTLFLDSSGIERGRAIGAPKRNELIEAITALKA
ncbi:MAG: thioredoxin [Actinobacteria bacterium]|jgi:thiol-disulfide isomerase/thioredoxin|nr:thioredoxin [Actinomycetota bacterium]NDB07730.1 thioredoxin [Actinomycetota bacterium]